MGADAAENVLLSKLGQHTGILHKAFLELDTDGSGQLDMGEFGRVLERMNIKVSPSNLKRLVQRW